MKKILPLILLSLTLFSCASINEFLDRQSRESKNNQPLSYLDNAPKYKVEEFLNGKIEGFAIVQDENGKITDAFTTSVIGEWEEKRGTVKYNFVFNGGKKDARTWLITSKDSESYTAIGHDFSKPAQGRQTGNASEIIYNLLYDYKGKKENVNFKDEIYMIDKNSAIVISSMTLNKKNIGKIILSLKKAPVPQAAKSLEE
jgi:hypothetical protein